jgi:hypothetical protein
MRLRLIAAVAALAILPALLPPTAGAATAGWTFEPAGWAFGVVMPGEKAPPPAELKLTNTGDVSLRPAFVSLDHEGGTRFELFYDACTGPLAPGGSCLIEVGLEPGGPERQEASLEVVDANMIVPPAVALLTAGVAPTVSVDPMSSDFGTVAVRGDRPTQTVTVTNAGSSGLSISSVEIVALSGWSESEPVPPPISWTGGSCRRGLFLPAGGSCNAGIEFAPDKPGFDSSELVITDTGFGSPQRVGIAGTAGPEAALPPPPARPEAARAALQRHPAKRTKSRTATFTFSGNATATGFECRLDKQLPRSCTSPTRYRSLKPGNHYFSVRAVSTVPDAGGQAIGATYGWRIVHKHRPRRKHAHQHPAVRSLEPPMTGISERATAAD